ncbi:MAG: hypothetical protein M1454_02850 [Candidatus Thermoplasmatota archaeon]|nr:hypothetical protein [Candidatus Thermoplasmatota archaeon]MCL5731408.1 hypothetical protein [Candidatus Thermoplasmatota archaeon]
MVDSHIRSESRKGAVAVIVGQAFIFLTFYSVLANLPDPVIWYYIFEVGTPLMIGIMFYCNRDVAISGIKSLGNVDMFVFFTTIIVWMVIWTTHDLNPYGIFWEQGFTDEINFRLFMIPYMSRFITRGRAVILQAVLFTVYYSNYLVFAPGGFPGIYFYFFIFDIFSMGIIYGVIYLIRKSIYIDLSIHLSLYAMAFIVVSLGWIPYLFLPS